MIIDTPPVAQLKQLWQQAFGDPEAFIDAFFRTGFSPERCRCIQKDGRVAAVLYWFDCECRGEKLAYLYGVATEGSFRGQGLCHSLMEDTHTYLTGKGYAGTVLVPGNEGLFRFYEGMGYQPFGGMREFSCAAAEKSCALRTIEKEEYAFLRRQLLPQGGVVQEAETLDFLRTQANFYAGEDFVLAAVVEDDRLFAPELLGNTSAAPQILSALQMKDGRFRTPGTEKCFAMYRPLTQEVPPAYFGLALD